MFDNLIFTILFGGLIGWATTALMLAICKYTLKTLPHSPQRITKWLTLLPMQEVKQALEQQIEAFDLEALLRPSLEQRLALLIERLKGRIPMGHMFLTGSLAKTLKEEALCEVFEMLPELKGQVLHQLQEQVNPTSSLKDLLEVVTASTTTMAKLRGLAIKLQLLGALIGFVIGSLVGLFFFFFP